MKLLRTVSRSRGAACTGGLLWLVVICLGVIACEGNAIDDLKEFRRQHHFGDEHHEPKQKPKQKQKQQQHSHAIETIEDKSETSIATGSQEKDTRGGGGGGGRTKFHGHHRPKNNLCDSARPLQLHEHVQGTTFNATSSEEDIEEFGANYFIGLTSCEFGSGYVQGSLEQAPGVWYTFIGTGGGMEVQLCTNDPNRKAADSYLMKIYKHPGSDRCHHPGHCVAMSDGYNATTEENDHVDDDDDNDDPQCVTVPVGTVEGKDYHVLVTETVPSKRSDFFHMALKTFETVPNDVCVQAAEIQPGHDFTGTISTKSATEIVSEPCTPLQDHQVSFVQRKKPAGVWYSVKGTGDTMQLAYPICRNDNDNTLLTYNVYKGQCNNQLQCVGDRGYITQSHMCLHNHDHSTDAITFPTEPHETYYIAVQSNDAGTADRNHTLNLRIIQPGHDTHIVPYSSDQYTINSPFGKTPQHVLLAISSNVVLFFIIFAFAASIETKRIQQQLQNQPAISIGIAMQFLIMPLMAFFFVLLVKDYHNGFTQSMGITLLVLMASPGGAFSNWWSSTFDADIALSVLMTTMSTLLSVALLPANVYLWSTLAYGGVGDPKRFQTIFIPLITVLFALLVGFIVGYQFKDNVSFRVNMNRLGTFAGTFLILILVYVSSAEIFGQTWVFYLGIIMLCITALIFSTLVARYSLKIPTVDCVTIAIESSFPNIAIATSFAVTMFKDPVIRAQAMAVPVFYGLASFFIITLYCLWASRQGWTLNPELGPDGTRALLLPDHDGEDSPVDVASYYQRATFQWLTPYINWVRFGARNKQRSTPPLPKRTVPSYVLDRFQYEVEYLKTTPKKDSENLISIALWRIFRSDLVSIVLLLTTAALCWVVVPSLWIRQLIRFAGEAVTGQGVPRQEGFLLALGLMTTELIRMLCIENFWYRAGSLACQLKALVYGIVFTRALSLRKSKDLTPGELMNLCTNDGERLFEGVRLAPTLYLGCLLVVLNITLSTFILGPAALVGIGIILCVVPLQIIFARFIGRLRKKGLSLTNERVGVMTELLTDMKLVKMYNWETAFSDKVAGLRKREQSFLKPAAYFSSMVQSITFVLPTLSAMITFVVHVKTGGTLVSRDAFAVVGLFNTMMMPLSVFPQAVRALAEGIIGWKHLGKILVATNYISQPKPPADESIAIEISNGYFDWAESEVGVNQQEPEEKVEGKEYKATLSDVNLTVPMGQLVGVCGAVGSGKSTMCSALLGEIQCTSGSVAVNGSVAYVSQQAWIIPGTVRENVLFGKPYDPERYDRAVKACCLDVDLKIMPLGDETKIGERGINLSGGQKQRMSLARAVYSDRDVYIFDDPLSAVDPHVGRHIFNECILGVLKGKTIFFVTHNLQYISSCNSVAYIEKGTVSSGQFDDMIANNESFNSFLQHLKTSTKSEDEEGGDDENEDGEEKDDAEKDAAAEAAAAAEMEAELKSSMESAVNAQMSNKAEKDKESSPQAAGSKFSWETIKAFGQAGDGLFVFGLIILFFIIVVGMKVFSDRWLAIWISRGDGTSHGGNVGDNPYINVYIFVYISVVGSFIVLQAAKGFVFNRYMLNASTRMHNQLVKILLDAPLWFYDTKPIGHILARVAKDIDEVDVRIPMILEQFISYSSLICFTLVLVSVIFPPFVIALPFVVVFYTYTVRRFLPAQFYSKRIENISSGPVLSHMVASFEGIAIIRAFGAKGLTLQRFWNLFDEQARGLFYLFAVQAWAAFRIDFVALSIVSMTALLVPVTYGSVGPGLTALALVYANSLAGIWHVTTRLGTEVVARLTSIERIMDYINNVPSEPVVPMNAVKGSPEWPTAGQIEMEKMSAAYRDGLPDVLKSIDICITAGEKVGVVGRTGSGKSTLSLCLFRLIAKLKGKITIDGVDTSQVPLDRLRSSLGIIPQDPVLFLGTIRYNLDPFGLHDDMVLWSALERSHLKDSVKALPHELDTMVLVGGSNFSVGERQLLCMARALLRGCKIMVLDEATSAIDTRTDKLIQQTIRTEFANCTVLTIAHRIDTIEDADKILVLDKGSIVEFDSPENLMANPDSTFKSMVEAYTALSDSQ